MASVKRPFPPQLVASAVRCDGAILAGFQAGMASFTPEEVAPHLVVPVHSKLRDSRLRQETNPDWDRYIADDDSHDSVSLFPPVLISARSRWRLDGGRPAMHDRGIVMDGGHPPPFPVAECARLEIYAQGVVVDGANRLESLLRRNASQSVPVMVILGLDALQELELRRTIQSLGTTKLQVRNQERVGTATPRLTIDSAWLSVTLCSEPFVVPTYRGYAPAILVQRPGHPQREHIFIGARSLATEIESLRNRLGTLVGAGIEVRKISAARTAPYDVRLQESGE